MSHTLCEGGWRALVLRAAPLVETQRNGFDHTERCCDQSDLCSSWITLVASMSHVSVSYYLNMLYCSSLTTQHRLQQYDQNLPLSAKKCGL